MSAEPCPTMDDDLRELENVALHAATAVRLVVGVSTAAAGEEYFRALLTELTATLGVDYAFVAQLIDDAGLRAETVAFQAGDEQLPPLVYRLKGTPCEHVVEGEFFVVERHAAACFPQDQLLTDLAVDSYAGVLLKRKDGAIAGWLAVMHREPLENAGLVETALRFLASRTAIELEMITRERELVGEREALAQERDAVTAQLWSMRLELHGEKARRRRAEEAVADERRRFELLASCEGFWEWNASSDALHLSSRAAAALGGSSAPRTLQQWIAASHPSSAEKLRATVAEVLSGVCEQFDIEHQLILANGEERWVVARARTMRGDTGNVSGLIGSITDVTDRKRFETQLLHDALHDELTGLANRSLFIEHLDQALDSVARGHKFAVLFLDLDRFKVVNDSLGHLAGDELLHSCAERLRLSVRPGDIVARLGGDEFAILLDHIADLSDATIVADRIRCQLARPFNVNGRDIFTAASIGIAIGDASYACSEDLLRDADTALYRAKESGKSRYEVFNVSMHARAMHRLQIETDLRHAIDREELSLAWQPIVSTSARNVVGFEGLLRWSHPQLGAIGPASFIPVAEETGLIVPIGEWVIQQAVHQLTAWSGTDLDHLVLSVNLSPRQLHEKSFSTKVAELTRNAPFDMSKLQLEITETAIIEDAETTAQALSDIYSLGVRLCVDDFGTGYSSLAYLVSLPVTALKIDRAFVQSIDTSPGRYEMIRAVIALAHNLGFNVITEGVETEAQYNALLRCKSDFVQGFIFSHGVPLDVAEKLARRLQLKMRKVSR